MKTIILAQLLACLSCVSVPEPVVPTNVAVADDVVFDTERINDLELSLVERKGQCSLRYKNLSSGEAGFIDIPMAAPCNFVRSGKSDGSALSFSFRQGPKLPKSHIFMVVGGPPSADLKDRVQPNGCGTEMRAVKVVGKEIKISQLVDHGASITCPTSGLDEVFFATSKYN